MVVTEMIQPSRIPKRRVLNTRSQIDIPTQGNIYQDHCQKDVLEISDKQAIRKVLQHPEPPVCQFFQVDMGG